MLPACSVKVPLNLNFYIVCVVVVFKLTTNSFLHFKINPGVCHLELAHLQCHLPSPSIASHFLLLDTLLIKLTKK